MAITRTRLKPPFNKVVVVTLLLVSLAALLLLLLVPEQWPVPVSVHLVCWGFLMYPTLCPNCGWFGPVVKSFRSHRKEVWLTIDDGPHPENTPKILALLERFHARATFFVIGERVSVHPQLARAILKHGHTLGNHSATHPTAVFWSLPSKAARWEIEEGLAAIREATGTSPAWFRAPVGMANFFVHQIIRQREMRLIGWSACGCDSTARDAPAVVEKIWRHIHPGAIVLLHDCDSSARVQPVSLLALEAILMRLHAQGYKCVIPEEEQLCS
jgi:peptidoglycan/xylan/chitin deacetylase (PgdA/CDA1 family)